MTDHMAHLMHMSNVRPEGADRDAARYASAHIVSLRLRIEELLDANNTYRDRMIEAQALADQRLSGILAAAKLGEILTAEIGRLQAQKESG